MQGVDLNGELKVIAAQLNKVIKMGKLYIIETDLPQGQLIDFARQGNKNITCFEIDELEVERLQEFRHKKGNYPYGCVMVGFSQDNSSPYGRTYARQQITAPLNMHTAILRLLISQMEQEKLRMIRYIEDEMTTTSRLDTEQGEKK